MPGTTPTVETVRDRADRPKPSRSCSQRTAPTVASTFARGSPIPMNTTFVTCAGTPSTPSSPEVSRRCITVTCRTTSPTPSWRRNPAWPVAQNRQWPLAVLLEACRRYQETTGRRLTFEYVLIAGINDRPEHAEQLAGLVGDFGAHVNLIPMNPTPAVPWRAPPVAEQRAFAARLEQGRVRATIRHNRGGNIDAACGQLYADYLLGSGRTLPAAVGAAGRVEAGGGR